MIYETLKKYKSAIDDRTTTYSFAEISAKYNIKHTIKEESYYLFMNNDDGCIEFIMISFNNQEHSPNDNAEAYYDIIFIGHGFEGNLREMRHIYWNPEDDGYIYYLPGKSVIKALEILQQHFDMD